MATPNIARRVGYAQRSRVRQLNEYRTKLTQSLDRDLRNRDELAAGAPFAIALTGGSEDGG